MATEVRMPQLGESVHEGTVGRWLKQVGDSVAKYEPLLEVITDKVDTEVTASEAGTVLRIVAAEGEVVKVGAVLAIIGAAGEVAPDVADAREAPGTPAASGASGAEPPADAATAAATVAADPVAADSSADSAPTPTAARVSPVAARIAADHGIDAGALSGTGPGGQVRREDVERAIAGAADAAADGPAPTTSTTDIATADAPMTGASTSGASATDAPATSLTATPAPLDLTRNIGFISPRVARAAAEHGVDLRYVSGTGQDQRITARDVERFVAAGGMAAAQAAESAAAAGPSAPALAPAAPTITGPASAPVGAPASSPAPAAAPASTNPADFIGEIMPLTRMRRLIADHMVKSIQTSPHVATIHEVDMSAAMAAYKAQKDAVAARGGRLTITAIIVDCVAKALVKHPLVNSAWTDEGVRIHRDVNIGMAVAIANGLIVPVIKHASTKSLVGLAADIDDLAKRARDGALKPDDIQGGTFTITNYGTLGSLFGTPVINQPQCAILGTGAIKKRVVVVETPLGDLIAIRPMMYLALTFDHRILDGGTADPFMRTITELLEGYSA